MALELTKLMSDFGIEVDGAYVKVIFFAIDVQSEAIGINLGYYASKEAADAKKPYIKQIQIGIGPRANVIQQEVKHPVTGDVLIPKVEVPAYADVAKAGAGKTAFDSVKAIIYQLVKVTLPEFSVAKDV